MSASVMSAVGCMGHAANQFFQHIFQKQIWPLELCLLQIDEDKAKIICL
jgi:hypothetical protein